MAEVAQAPAGPAEGAGHGAGNTLLLLLVGVLVAGLGLVIWYAQAQVERETAPVAELRQTVADLTAQRNQLEAERDKLAIQRDQLTKERDRLLARIAGGDKGEATTLDALPANASSAPTAQQGSPDIASAGKDGDVVRLAIRSAAMVRSDRGSGSAFKYRQRGTESLFVTNAHVVRGGSDFSLVTLDGKAHTARVLGRDDAADLAVLAVEGQIAIPALKLGDSATLRAGDALYVVGFALGINLSGEPSVTRGVFSGHRSISAVDYLQTDASMNPGNSGGPVINSSGELVGVATAGIRDGAGLIQGINLAIPSNTVRDIFDRIAR